MKRRMPGHVLEELTILVLAVVYSFGTTGLMTAMAFGYNPPLKNHTICMPGKFRFEFNEKGSR
jgi:hypothetical protein